MKRQTTRSSQARLAASTCLALLCLAEMAAAHAWSLTITSGSRRLFLHVGNGAMSGTSGTLNGTAGTSGPVNLVQVTVPAAQLGNGTDLAMTSDSTQSTSLYADGYNTCPTPASQVMIDREEDEDHDARRRVGNEQLDAHQGPTPRRRTAIERDIRERARDTRQTGADEVHYQTRHEPRDLVGTGAIANSHAAVRPVEIAPAPTQCDPRR